MGIAGSNIGELADNYLQQATRMRGGGGGGGGGGGEDRTTQAVPPLTERSRKSRVANMLNLNKMRRFEKVQYS